MRVPAVDTVTQLSESRKIDIGGGGTSQRNEIGAHFS